LGEEEEEGREEERRKRFEQFGQVQYAVVEEEEVEQGLEEGLGEGGGRRGGLGLVWWEVKVVGVVVEDEDPFGSRDGREQGEGLDADALCWKEDGPGVNVDAGGRAEGWDRFGVGVSSSSSDNREIGVVSVMFVSLLS
jgi:hypothetical protein